MRISDWSSDVCSSDLAVVWVATSAIEPFYVGAGLGLYLNRRTRIEAWDVEIALRRMRTRLATTATALLLAIGAVSLLPLPSQAARSEEHTSELQSLMRISYAVFCLTKKKQQHVA